MNSNHNILITSAGKRVTLVKIFQDTLTRYFPGAKVYTTDMNPAMAPAGIVSDKCFSVPRVTADDYIDILLDICRHNGISVVVPTIDTELMVLAQNKELFKRNGINVMISYTHFISLCRDKRNTNDFFSRHGIRVPKPVDITHPTFPLFAKPYDGSLSKDLHVITGSEELTPEIRCNPKLIFMEYIDKTEYTEYTVDMYYGRDNKVKSIVPRERIEIRAGEINKGRTRKNRIIPFLKQHIGYLEGVVGCICMQLFYKESDEIIAIEINPRFGGGYPLSFYAKANFPEYIIQEYMLGKTLNYAETWLDNALMLRYDSDIIVYDKN